MNTNSTKRRHFGSNFILVFVKLLHIMLMINVCIAKFQNCKASSMDLNTEIMDKRNSSSKDLTGIKKLII